MYSVYLRDYQKFQDVEFVCAMYHTAKDLPTGEVSSPLLLSTVLISHEQMRKLGVYF